jgi:6-phosphogluconolactonase
VAHVIAFSELDELARKTCLYLQNGTIALSGGTTYANLFPYWVSLKPDIRRCAFFSVDERMVAFNHEASNWRIAFERFLAPLGKESDRQNRPSSLEQYLRLLKSAFNDAMPVFDVIFLGVGDDGHTASLFPGGPYLDDTESIVLQTKSPKPPVERLTLGPGVIAAARTVIAIIAGENKKRIMQKIIEKDDKLPVVKVLSRRPESYLYVEQRLIKS